MSVTTNSIRLLAMRLLVCGSSDLPVVVDAITARGGWPAVTGLVERWKVFPALSVRAVVDRVPIPQDLASQLARNTAVQFFRTTVCMRAGCDTLRLLTEAGIPALAFKGAAVLAHLHTGMRDRMVRDVDVLIRPDDLHASLSLLEAKGFRRCIGEGSIEDYISFVEHSPGSAGNHAISLVNQQDAAVDLHWKLGRFDSTRLLESAVSVEVLGTPIRVVRPAFGLLLTVHHALRNDLVPDEIARDLLDCTGWFRWMAARPGEMECACEEAARLGLAEVLGAMAVIVRELGGQAPESLGKAPASRALADLYFRQLEEGPINTDLAYLGSGRAGGQILKGALTGWRRYQGIMRAFESRQGEASLSLTQRGLRLVRSVVRLSPRHWHQLRALTRAKDRLSE
jgi:hypothetical protein